MQPEKRKTYDEGKQNAIIKHLCFLISLREAIQADNSNFWNDKYDMQCLYSSQHQMILCNMNEFSCRK